MRRTRVGVSDNYVIRDSWTEEEILICTARGHQSMTEGGNLGISGLVLRADHGGVCEHYDRCGLPDDPVLVLRTAYSLLKRKRAVDASDAVLTLCGNTDIMSTVYVNYVYEGILALGSEDWPSAVKSLDMALRVTDTDYLPYVAMAEAFTGMNMPQEAESYLRKAQELEPNSFEAWFRGLFVMLKLRKIGDANACLREARRIRPDCPV